jgi:hypothetical protein
LEFIACIITIWIESLNNSIEKESCILRQTDSSSAYGWLRKSNFSDTDDEIVQMTMARHLAYLLLSRESCLYSQWFAGDENQVADSLSRDFHFSDHQLTQLITSSLPEQVPFGFQIHPLPREIISWLTSLLQNQPCKEQWLKQLTQRKLLLGKEPTSWLTDKIQDWMPIKSLPSFYNAKSEVTKTQTIQNNNK